MLTFKQKITYVKIKDRATEIGVHAKKFIQYPAHPYKNFQTHQKQKKTNTLNLQISSSQKNNSNREFYSFNNRDVSRALPPPTENKTTKKRKKGTHPKHPHTRAPRGWTFRVGASRCSQVRGGALMKSRPDNQHLRPAHVSVSLCECVGVYFCI